MNDLVVRRIGRLTTWTTPRNEGAAVVVTDGKVAWVGADRELPAGLADRPELDAGGAAVIPGFVDCHTHAVWAGDRRADFTGRLAGGDYQPHGIQATVAATRAAGEAELMALTCGRIERMRANGTTAVEIKSGYGLTAADELRMLDVAAVAGRRCGIEASTTYLGAHVVPSDRNRDEYVEDVLATLPAAVQHGARWCDVFCEQGAFTVEEARRILCAGIEHGLGARIHADQLSNIGASRLAAEIGCASADHLDHVTAEDAAALAAADVVGVLVPVASLYTRSDRWGHGQVLQAAGVQLAIATDCNPGTANCESMPYAVQLACLAMGLGVDDALRAATLGGAQALRRTDLGHLGVGARADLLVLSTDHEIDVVARLGAPAVSRTVAAGVPV